MGPCQSFMRNKSVFYKCRDDYNDYDQDENKKEAKRPMLSKEEDENKKEAKRPMLSKEELTGALKCINPKYREEDIKNILEYALRSQTVSEIILRCATDHGFKEKLPSSIHVTTDRY